LLREAIVGLWTARRRRRGRGGRSRNDDYCNGRRSFEIGALRYPGAFAAVQCKRAFRQFTLN
jgi:hypothetical protein